MMRVILTTVDQTRCKIFFLNNNDTIGQAKSLWAKEENCDINSFVLASGGQIVSDVVVLEELPQLCPGIMELLVDAEVLLPVRAFRLQDEAKELTSFRSMRAEELYGSARELLGIAEGHETRFRVGDRVLAGERTLLENSVDAASGVDVEVGWRATVQRVGCCDEEVVLFFSEVLSAVASPWRRVLYGDRLLRSAAEVEALLVSAFEASHAERLVLEESSPVSVQEDGAVKCEAVWPQKGLMSEDAPSEVMFEDRVMAGGDPQSLVVPPPWVLHRAPLHLVARLTSGRRMVLRVPRDGAVSDVVKAARPLEGARRKLQLVVGCREVDAHASLRALGLQDGSHVRLLCPPSSIVVFLGELQLRWELPLTQDVASFGEIVAAVSPGNSPGNRTRRRILLSGLLVCEGCGRRLSKERQAFQVVPAACCELRSMRLRFAAKTAPREPDVTKQIIPLLGPKASPCLVDAESQTDGPVTADAAAKKEKKGKKIRKKAATASQSKPETAPKSHVDVAVYTIPKIDDPELLNLTISPSLSKAASETNVCDPINVDVQTIPKSDPTISPSWSKAASETNVCDPIEVPVLKKSSDDNLETIAGSGQPTVVDSLLLIGVVSIHLTDGFVFLCGIETTLEYVIDVLQRERYIFRNINFFFRGNSLASKKGWKKQTLKEHGVNDGDQVTLNTPLPQTVVVAVDGKSERFEASVNVGENCWQRIQPKLAIPDDITFNVFYQERLYFHASDGNCYSAVNSRKQGKQENVFISEKTGGEILLQEGEKYTFGVEFLSPTQRMAFALTGDPILFISSGCAVGLEEVANGTVLTTLPPEAFFYSQYIAMVHGFYFAPPSKKKSRHIALLTRSGKLSFTGGGKVFDNIEEIRASQMVKDLTEQRTWILLRENDLIPHWLFPRGLVICLYRREGVDLQIENERLVRKNCETSTEESRWIIPQEADELDENFGKAVRNGQRKTCGACVTKFQS